MTKKTAIGPGAPGYVDEPVAVAVPEVVTPDVSAPEAVESQPELDAEGHPVVLGPGAEHE